MTGEAPGPPQRRKGVQGGSGLARHWFRGRFQASALPLVKLWAVLRSGSPLEGPGSLARHWFRSGSRLPFGPLGRLILPAKPESGAQTCAFGSLLSRTWLRAPARPGGSGSPDSAANSGRAGLTPPSLAQRLRENAFYPGASGGPDSAANSGRDGPTPPRWKAVALHGGPGGSPAALCHFLSAEKVKPGLPVRPE